MQPFLCPARELAPLASRLVRLLDVASRLCRLVAGRPSVAYLGPAGSFSHEVAHLIASSGEHVEAESISSVAEMVQGGYVDLGVIPLENSVDGPVGEAIDALASYEVYAVMSIDYPLNYVLASRVERLEDVRRVYSHPKALAAVSKWLDMLVPWAERVPVESTSRAARLASTEEGAAAVCGWLAAKLYHLRVLAERRLGSRTRFLVVASRMLDAGDRTGLVMALEHKPGSLYHFLEPLARAGVNLTRLYSWPAKARPWAYHFLVEMEGELRSRRLLEALREALKTTLWSHLLGSYPHVEVPPSLVRSLAEAGGGLPRGGD